ncbi:MAG: helix-turn-helix transcriptional regulator, partial [Propionibacteriaceae bacterium]|nr:helix-turn-helix transcriptional regulator [Propionibacteriaceae bacterium]
MDRHETPRTLITTDPIASIDPEAVGEQLMRARKASGLTQQQAATELGVARTTITAIESGARRPRPAEFVRLAQLYRRSVGDLLRAATQPRSIGFEVFFRTAGG